jgi:hypothetical protein
VVAIFTGLVEATGTLAGASPGRLRFSTPLAAELSDGDSRPSASAATASPPT